MSEKNIIKELDADFPLLIEAGFLAIQKLQENSARKLFQAAEALRPESALPQLGYGYIQLNKMEIPEATKSLTEALKKEPTNELAKVFLGITHMLQEDKRKEGEKLIHEVLATTEDPTVQNFGKTALEWEEKDLISKKAPFFQNT